MGLLRFPGIGKGLIRTCLEYRSKCFHWYNLYAGMQIYICAGTNAKTHKKRGRLTDTPTQCLAVPPISVGYSDYPSISLCIPRPEIAECLDKLLHLREVIRAGGALTFAATASDNAVVGGCNHRPDVLH